MSLGGSMSRTVKRLQKQAESAMRTPVIVTRGDGETDIYTGEKSTSIVWEGNVKIKEPSTVIRGGSLADNPVTVLETEIHLPVDTPLLHEGDVITLLGGDLSWTVTQTHYATYMTAQRVKVNKNNSEAL